MVAHVGWSVVGSSMPWLRPLSGIYTWLDRIWSAAQCHQRRRPLRLASQKVHTLLVSSPDLASAASDVARSPYHLRV